MQLANYVAMHMFSRSTDDEILFNPNKKPGKKLDDYCNYMDDGDGHIPYQTTTIKRSNSNNNNNNNDIEINERSP